jgi:predicted phosphodiesterase
VGKTGMLRRLGVIGDVHCESATLGRVLGVLGSMNLDVILCVGDLVDGPGDADATLRMLQARGVECVAGNHDRS